MKATRRAAITASGVAVVGLAACTAGGSASAPTRTNPSQSSATEPAAPDPDPDPDRATLDRAAELSTDLLALAAAAGQAGDPGGRFKALHTAHLAALDRTAAPSTGTQPGLPGPRAAARIRRREAAAQHELAALAQDAQSGALARLLASMSAGIAAHVSALPRQAVR